MTTREAGKRLGVNDSRIRQLIGENRLKTERAGHIHLISEEELERLRVELAAEADSGKKPGPVPNVLRATPPARAEGEAK